MSGVCPKDQCTVQRFHVHQPLFLLASIIRTMMGEQTSSNDVLVRQRNTLRRTRRAGGVHDAAKVFRAWRNGLDGVFLAQLPKIVDAHDAEIAKVGLDFVQILLLGFLVGVVDNVFDRLDILQDVVKGADKGRIEEDGDTLSLYEGMLQSFFS